MDEVPSFTPVMLHGLTWPQAKAALEAVDCAVRRAHWCSPVVILHEGRPVLDDDGHFMPFTFMRGDRSATDWSMIPRRDENGDEITPAYRIEDPHHG